MYTIANTALKMQYSFLRLLANPNALSTIHYANLEYKYYNKLKRSTLKRVLFG